MIRAFTVLTLGMAMMSASAQTLDGILANVNAQQKQLKDLSMRVIGSASFEDNSQKIDFQVQTIPAKSLTRIQFNAPDTLADNILIIDKNTLYNYLYLTNQVTVGKIDKNQVSGLNFDFAKFTDVGTSLNKVDFNLKLLKTVQLKEGKAFVIEAIPKDDLGFNRSQIWILDRAWRPIKMQAFDKAGKVQAEFNFSAWKTNSGLLEKKLKALPKDAQVIKR